MDATRASPKFVRRGDALPRTARRIRLEDGSEMDATGGVSLDIPYGYHELLMRDGTTRSLVVTPGQCHPPPQRAWGWAVQLYALRSARSWGMGDLGDLRAVASWAGRLGAGLLIVNPLHAAEPRIPQDPSPYYVSSRLFRNPLYIDIGAVPGARDHELVHELSRQARRLSGSSRIDRDRIFSLKMKALAVLWEDFVAGSAWRDFETFMSHEGDLLRHYATYCALREVRRQPWPAWPQSLRSPHSPAVRRFERGQRRRVDFHCWLQWLLQRQLAAVSRNLPVVSDLAVGFAPDGFDAWLWQDVLAEGVHIGAPPDEFSLAEQDWGLAPFDPRRLRRAGYRPLIETLRRVMRGSAGVRIDHVMGMFRLWWTPSDHRLRRAGYVRYPASEMLDVLTLESERAGCYVVGEDLGTVEAGVRAEMRRRGALSYRVAWFESRPPRLYPRLALAAMSTHDLPTVAGVWTGDDLRDQEQSGRAINRAGEQRTRKRLTRLTGAKPDTALEEVVERAYAALASAPSALIAASLEDVTLARRRPNLPGAPRRENWSIPLPRTLEQIRRDPLPQRIATILNGAQTPAASPRAAARQA